MKTDRNRIEEDVSSQFGAGRRHFLWEKEGGFVPAEACIVCPTGEEKGIEPVRYHGLAHDPVHPMGEPVRYSRLTHSPIGMEYPRYGQTAKSISQNGGMGNAIAYLVIIPALVIAGAVFIGKMTSTKF